MKNSNIDKEIKKNCPFCGKEYILRYLTYPCKLEDKRNATIFCPHCNKDIESIYLQGNEDIDTIISNN